MIRIILCLLCLPAVCLAETAANQTAKVHIGFGKHPRVFLTSDEAEAMRQRADREPWAGEVRKRIVSEADALVAEPLEIPHEGGQWSHWFTCPGDGTRLRSKSPTQHVCATCEKVYSGYPYDQVYVASRHHHWLGGVETLGLAYALDPKPAYVERARKILLEYASFYSSLPLHDTRNEKGSAKARLFAQTLDESVVLCRVAVGCDLLWDAEGMHRADRRAIRKGLLLPMVETIRANDRGISNWQSWHNAAVGCVGFLLRERQLVDWAVNGTHGFIFQLRHSLLPDGMWYEASPSYHWYALQAHVYLLEAAERAGMNLYAQPAVKRMFDAPLRIVLPDGTFPPINDSDRSAIEAQGDLYEVAYRRFEDPRYVSLLSRRASPQALMWGAETVSEDCAATPEPSDDVVDGLAILRDDNGKTAAYIDFSPALSGHVQPAKLGLLLYAHDDIRIVDPGRVAYGNPLHRGWYTQTVAHNTVVVGAASQAACAGTLAAFRSLPDGGQLARVTCDAAYPGVTLERTLLRRGTVYLDVFRCKSAAAQTYDLPLHFKGTLAGLPAAEPLGKKFSDKPAYKLLQDPRRVMEPLRAFDVDCDTGNRLHVQILDESKEVFLAKGHGNPPTEMLPVVIRRQRAPEATFVTVYQVLDAGEEPAKVEYREKPAPAFVVDGNTIPLTP